MYLETQKLYEKLSVLRFVDEHFSDVKPTIGAAALEQKIESIFDKTELIQTEIKPEIVETVAEEILETPTEDTKEVAEITEVETLLETVESTEIALKEDTPEEQPTKEEDEEEE